MHVVKRFFWYSAGCAAIALGALSLDVSSGRPPAVWWVHPARGAPGTLVHIVGNGFGDASLVTFGGTRAEFSLTSPLVIRARVPAGAATGPISVTTSQGTVTSPAAFPVQTWPDEP